MFKQSSPPTHDSIHGCVKPKNNLELSVYISNAQNNGDGQVRLCPGTIHFYDEIELDDSITLSCSAPKGMCILDGHGVTRHFLSFATGITLAFIDLALINGFVDNNHPFGGSLRLAGSTSIFNGCLFYNNRVTSSFDSIVSIMCKNTCKVFSHACQYYAIPYSNTHFFHCTFTLFRMVVQSMQVLLLKL